MFEYMRQIKAKNVLFAVFHEFQSVVLTLEFDEISANTL